MAVAKVVQNEQNDKLQIYSTITLRGDRVMSVTKELLARVRAFMGNPKVQVASVSAGGSSIALGFCGALAGGVVGGAAGLAVGVVPALFTFGLSIPVGGIIGAAIGGGGCAVVGSGTGFVGGGIIGGVGYAYRVQIIQGKVYIFARLKDVSDCCRAAGFRAKMNCIAAGNATISVVGRTGAATKRKSFDLCSAAKAVAVQRKYQVTAATAAGGGAAGCVGGGVIGLATGATAGGVAGVIPAIFTFGLSIPAGAAIGGGFGACAGSVIGTSTGAMVGGGAGYGTYTKRKEIATAIAGTATYVKDTGSAGKSFISRKVCRNGVTSDKGGTC